MHRKLFEMHQKYYEIIIERKIEFMFALFSLSLSLDVCSNTILFSLNWQQKCALEMFLVLQIKSNEKSRDREKRMLAMGFE